MKILLLILNSIVPLIFILSGQSQNEVDTAKNDRQILLDPDRYNVAFLIMDGVYNTDLTAPCDIFQLTIFSAGIKAMNAFFGGRH